MNNLTSHLHSLGVQSVYFCSGSRNHSLKEFFTPFQMNFHFDERVSSFMALGEAKLTGCPVVICTTSGTAVAECLPAMIEAYYSNVKLIMISADRPERLRFSHAPQAINQLSIFKDFARTKYTGTLLTYTADEIHYPYHINLEIDDAKTNLSNAQVEEIKTLELQQLLTTLQSPLVLFTEDDDDNSSYFNLFNDHGFYVYKECTSNINLNSPNLIKYDHTLTKMLATGSIDGIIKFGRTPITKIWRLLDNTYPEIPVVCVGQEQTGLSRGYLFSQKEELFELTLKKFNSNKIDEPNILLHKNEFPQSEMTVFDSILDEIPLDSYVFLGNSMAIRYGDLLSRDSFIYLAMRGANGIDGQISTAIGVAANTHNEVHLIIGDLTFLYDLSALIVKIPTNLFIHVLNNQGGRIFERINLSHDVINEHNLDFEKLVHGFSVENIKFYKIDNSQTNKYWELIK